MQTSRQLFGAVNHDDGVDDNRRTLPLLFDGKKFLLQEQPVVCPANTTVTSQTDKSDTTNTSGVSVSVEAATVNTLGTGTVFYNVLSY